MTGERVGRLVRSEADRIALLEIQGVWGVFDCPDGYSAMPCRTVVTIAKNPITVTTAPTIDVTDSPSMGQALAPDLFSDIPTGLTRRPVCDCHLVPAPTFSRLTRESHRESLNLSVSIAFSHAESRGAEVKINLNQVLTLGLVVSCSIANPFSGLPASFGETKTTPEVIKKTEPNPLPRNSSPLELRESKANSVSMKGKEQAEQNRGKSGSAGTTRPRATSAQNIPASVSPSHRPAVRQVAGPGPQNQHYQNQQSQENSGRQSDIQQQLDALYREKGLDAPVMSYEALPVQGQEDYEAMQSAQPHQASSAPQNGYRVNSSQPGSSRQSGAPQPTSWLQKIFGRRAKSSEPEQPAPSNTLPQYQDRQNQAQNGQYPDGQSQNNRQQQSGNQPQYNQNRQQDDSVQQQEQYNRSPQNQSSRVQQQTRQTQTAQQPRGAQPAVREQSSGGLDYSRLRQSRATTEEPAPRADRASQQRQVEAEEPEESLDFSDSTPRLETNGQEIGASESGAADAETPEQPGVRKRQPSPFDNLELHTPEEAESAEPGAEARTEQSDSTEISEEHTGAQTPTAQSGQNPLIVPENGPQSQIVQPIIGMDDSELAAKYRILAAFPELNGMKGFCPVALRDDRELIRSRKQFTASFNNRNFEFSSSEAMLKFKKSPEKYLPVADGNDIVQLSHNEAEVGTLDFAAWYRGRLYLFTGLDNLETFVNHPARYERIALGENPSAAGIDGSQEPEESLEFEDPVAGVEAGSESEGDQQPAAPSNQSPADALRGPARPPAGNRSQEKIDVPPPPSESDDEEEIDMPGNQRPTAKLSQKTGWKPACRTLAGR